MVAGIKDGRGWIARGLALAALCLAAAGATPARSAEEAEVVVRTDRTSGRFVTQRVTNAAFGSSYGQLSSSVVDGALTWVRATNALSYVRCYNWLGDGVPKDRPHWFSGARVARRAADGTVEYRWDGLERVLDSLVLAGVKPVIVCGGLPDALIEGAPQRNETGAAVNPPRDYAQYQDMIAQMVRRLVKTYGAKEVRSWYFEAWSHPDHAGSWDGARPVPWEGEVSASAVQPFLKLYDHFAAGVLGVDSKLRVGGPGLAGDTSFFRRFLEHCARGANHVTGKPGSRLDFVSWSAYGTGPEVAKRNAELRALVKGFPELKDAELHLSEWGAGPGEAPHSNSPYEAARLAALFDANARSESGVDAIFREGDLADDHFDGGHALITRLGRSSVPLPAFRLYMLLAKMASERLEATGPDGIGVVATRSGVKALRNATQVLLYRHEPSAAPGEGSARAVRLRVSGLPTELLRLPMRIYRIDAGTYDPHAVWTAAGSPFPAPDELAASLLGMRPLEPNVENFAHEIRGGEAVIELALPPNSVALVTLGAEPTYGVQLCPRGERLRRAEEDFSAAAELHRRGLPRQAVDELRKVAEKYSDTAWREAALISMVGIYELDLKSPGDAEKVRAELLTLATDTSLRIRLLERARVDAARANDVGRLNQISRQIEALEKDLEARLQWPLQRYRGGPAMPAVAGEAAPAGR
ncbi:MAG: GH39 family glycosyl hydrolase [Armatimonadota bacterium]